jgi:3-deoxy-manno-octulosonate cytidylyltransferase (CMP-KDO synthetase)
VTRHFSARIFYRKLDVVSDDKRICQLVEHSIMTSSSCENGTERCAEAALQLKEYDSFINVQGDLPDITSEIIQSLAAQLKENELVTAFTKMDEFLRCSPNTVKLVHNNSFAHWFCRAPLKYGDQHLGVYGYRRSVLLDYPNLPPSIPEVTESLEQLRWLSAGYKMKVVEVRFDGVEINCPNDLQLWEQKHITGSGE